MEESCTCECGSQSWIIFKDRLVCLKCNHEIPIEVNLLLVTNGWLHNIRTQEHRENI